MKENQKCLLCQYCAKSCDKPCKGKKFDLRLDYVKEGGFNPCPNTYIPSNGETSFALLMNATKHLRRPDIRESMAMRQVVAIADYAGHGKRLTFKGWGIYIVDFGAIGKKYGDLAIIECDTYFPRKGEKATPLSGPLRFDLAGHRVYSTTYGDIKA